MLLAAAQSRMAVPRAPLWLKKATRPGRRDDVREGRVEVHGRADVAEAVGADDAHAVALGDGLDLVLEALALLADLLEPGADDDGAGHAGLAALAHGLRHVLGRHGDDGEVDLARHLADARVGLDALHRLGRDVHRVDDPLVLGADQVAQEDVADRPLLVAGADDGDALGVEQLVEIACAHLSSSRLSWLLWSRRLAASTTDRLLATRGVILSATAAPRRGVARHAWCPAQDSMHDFNLSGPLGSPSDRLAPARGTGFRPYGQGKTRRTALRPGEAA